MKKITIALSSKEYEITIDDEFASYFEEELKEILNGEDTLSPKMLISAFVEKSYLCFKQSKAIKKLNSKIDELDIDK